MQNTDDSILMSTKTINYCLSYPLQLTRFCGNKCGYCTYPLTEYSPLPSKKSFMKEVRQGVELEAVQIELISGENLELVAEVQKNLKFYDFKDFPAYIQEMLKSLNSTKFARPLLSLLNIGNLEFQHLEAIRENLCVVQCMIESMDNRVASGIAHVDAPCKHPEERLNTILNCGRLSIPVATGMMIGIGEDDSSHLNTLELIANVFDRYRNIQSFEIQTFWPKEGTPLADSPIVSKDEILCTVEMARDILPKEISIVVKVQEHLDIIEELIDAGVTDLGSISVRNQDLDDPRFWKNLIHKARLVCDEKDLSLSPRLPLHQDFVHEQSVHNNQTERVESALQYLKKISA